MKGICFKEPLFRATIEGRKTQTRRIMKPQPKDCSEGHKNFEGAEWRNEPMDLVPDIFPGHEDEWDGRFVCRLCGNGLDWFSDKGLYKPRYKPGEVVYLKEPYYTIPKDTPPFSQADRYLYAYGRSSDVSPRWQNKLFMPAEAARYFIKITAVRAERLQDISDEDCMKEGIFSDALRCGFGLHSSTRTASINVIGNSFREAYSRIINFTTGKGTWKSNPFVWVYDYELTEKPKL